MRSDRLWFEALAPGTNAFDAGGYTLNLSRYLSDFNDKKKIGEQE